MLSMTDNESRMSSPLLFNTVLTGGPFQFNKEKKKKRSKRCITQKERSNIKGLIFR